MAVMTEHEQWLMSLQPEEKAELERRMPCDFMASLTFRCRDLYLKAAGLLEIDNQNVQRVTHRTTINVFALLEAYEIVKEIYVRKIHTDQLMLFPSDQLPPDLAWRRWFHDEFIPYILHHPYAVGIILRATFILPCTNYVEETERLEQFLYEMPMRQSYKMPHWCETHHLPQIEPSKPSC